MPGIGIGLGLGLGGGGALSEAAVARALAAKGLTDVQARTAIGGAASMAAGLRAVGLLPAAARPSTPADAVLVLEGDSIGFGFRGEGHVAIGQLGYPDGVAITNSSVSGTTLAAMLADAQAGAGPGAVPATLYDPARPCVVVVQRGTNDFTVDGRTGPALYDIATALVALYKAQGFHVAIETVLPRTYAWNATLEGHRTAYNALVRANAAGADAIVDGAADGVIGDGAGVSATCYADGLHLTAAGQDRKTLLYQAALPALLTRPPRARAALPAGAARPVRYPTLSGMTEAVGGGGASYGYTPTAADGHAAGGVALAAGVDGWVGYTLGTPQGNGTVIELMAAGASVFTPDAARIALHCNLAYNGGNYHVWHDGSLTTSNVAPVAGDGLRVRRAGSVLMAEYYRSGAWTVLFGFDAGGAPALLPAVYSQAAGGERTLANTVGWSVP